ncbi:MAG: 2-oxoacid:acceptor oxidoreductase family protein [Bacillota bacterium]
MLNNKEWQVILAGEGGQGLVFIGALLGEAAVLDGKYASQSASYTIASRGGFTKADVIISDIEISFPEVTEPDVVLALSAGSLEKYRDSLPPESLLIYDAALNGGAAGINRISLPLSAKVREAAANGWKAPLNLVGLGAVVGYVDIVSWDAFRKVLEKKFPSSAIVEANWNALQAGAALVK